MIVCKLMLAKKCIVKPKSVIRPTMVSLDVFLCHNSFIFAFCFKFCLDIARYVFNKIFGWETAVSEMAVSEQKNSGHLLRPSDVAGAF